MQLLFSISGAALLFLTAGYHLTGLHQVSDGLVGERRGLIRAAWVLVAMDWLLIGVSWIAAALQYLPPTIVIWTATVPLLGTVVLYATLGPRFPGVWLLGAAWALGTASGFV
jgi:hypothetical protein